MRTTKIFLTATILLATASVGAQEIEYVNPADLPDPLDREELEAIEDILVPNVLPVRTVENLPRGYRPRQLEGDGVATLITTEDGTRTLVTAHAWIANADSIEVYVGGVWVEAVTAHATVMFDLAELVLPEGTLDALPGAPLAEENSLASMLLAVAPVTEDDEPELSFAAFGPEPADDFAYYRRSLLMLRNGYPIFNELGAVVAISSIAAADNGGGVFVISANFVHEWFEEWPQLNADSPYGWEPEVTVETFEMTTGLDSLR